MAILETTTENYYKIDFDSCMIKGLTVFVSYAVYDTEFDRYKEKERLKSIQTFLDLMQQEASELYEKIMQGLRELKIEPQEALSLSEDNKIDTDRFPELRKIQDRMNDIEETIQSFYNYCYCFGKDEPLSFQYRLSKEDLLKFGFKESWVTNPIRLSHRAEINCGKYEGEQIDHEFYYTRLKTVMNREIIQDC